MFLCTISWLGLWPCDGMTQCFLHEAFCWMEAMESRMATWPFLIDCFSWYQFYCHRRGDRKFESMQHLRRIELPLGPCALILYAPHQTPASMKRKIDVPMAWGDCSPPAQWLLNRCPCSELHHDDCRYRQGFAQRMISQAYDVSILSIAAICT